MNYFEIINSALLELNYQQVAVFSDLTKPEHKRLMSIINRLNKEICNLNDKFYFRQLVKRTVLYPDKIEYSVDISGKIAKIIGNLAEYKFEPDYAKFYSDNPPENAYCTYGEKFLFSPSEDIIKIFYVTNNFVKAKNDILKADFEFETDESVIPADFLEKLLINGAAYNFKQNTAHPKYAHWKNEYNTALSEFLASAKNIVGSTLTIDGGYRKL